MKFIDKVQEQFKRAGWKEGRNVSSRYDSNKLKDYPKFIKDFLFEYGDLIVDDCKTHKSNIINRLGLKIEYSYFDEPDDFLDIESLISTKLFPIGDFEPDGYRIACDSDGKVYMLGDYTFLISNSLKEGIEMLVQDDWSKGYQQLDENTGKWVKDKKWNE